MNALKKLLSMMLVVMMLLSVVPFQAFAVEAAPGVEAQSDDAIESLLENELVKKLLNKFAKYEDEIIAAMKKAAVKTADEAMTFIWNWIKENVLTGEDVTPPATEAPEDVTPPATEEPEDVVTPPATEAPEADTYTLYFHYLNAQGVKTISTATVENGDKIVLPIIPLVSTKDFLYWQDGDGNIITEKTVWNIGESQNIYAVYEDDTTDDGIVELTVYAYYYVDGVYHHMVKLYDKDFEQSKKNTMFTWLYSNDGVETTRNALAGQADASGYQWNPVVYYDFYDNGTLTEADMKSDGPKTVYIKVNSKDAIEANVMLYVHTAKKAAVDRVIPMPGFTAGDYVSIAHVKAAVKAKYTGNISYSDLYDQGEWEDLLAGLDASGAKAIEVESNGVTNIHVIVKNATAGTTVTTPADSTNPKTGDMIFATVSTMVSSAAAAAYLFLNKKRFVK